MPFNTIKCLAISLVAHKVGGFSLFHLLFGVVSGSFQPVLACYGLYRVFPPFTNDGITCFVLQILSIIKRGKSYYKVGQLFCIKKQGKCYYKVGQLFCITKAGPVVLQRKVSQGGASFVTKWRQVLQSRATFITMWVRCYNVQQLLKGGIVQKANVTEMGRVIYFGNRLLDSTLIFLVTVNLPIGIPEKLNFCQNQKSEAITPPPQEYLGDLHV